MFPLSRMAWVAVSHCVSSLASPACRSASARFSNAWLRRSIARAAARTDCRISSFIPVPLCPPSALEPPEKERIDHCAEEAGFKILMRLQEFFQHEATSLDDILIFPGVGAPEEGLRELFIPGQPVSGEEVDAAAVQGIMVLHTNLITG